MLNSASKTAKFFNRDVDSTYPFWRLKTPEEHEAETNTKSKEARKYIFNCLDDIGQVNVPTDLEGQLLAEKTDRREFIDLLKRMLTIDQERRITPAEALNHAFTTLTHLVDYAHCNNVKASVQMMEVCRRADFHTVQPSSALVSNFVPNTTENMTFTINNQLSNQVQRLVRDRPAAAYADNLYQIYGSRNVGRQYTNTRNEFPHQLMSSILCQPGYQTMPRYVLTIFIGKINQALKSPYFMIVIYVFFVHFQSNKACCCRWSSANSGAATAICAGARIRCRTNISTTNAANESRANQHCRMATGWTTSFSTIMVATSCSSFINC